MEITIDEKLKKFLACAYTDNTIRIINIESEVQTRSILF